MTWRFKIVLFRTAGRSRRWFGDLINLTQGHALALLMHDIQMPTGITRTSKSLPFQIFLVIFIRLLLVHFVFFLVIYFVYFINTEKKNTKKNISNSVRRSHICGYEYVFCLWGEIIEGKHFLEFVLSLNSQYADLIFPRFVYLYEWTYFRQEWHQLKRFQ